MKQKELFGNGEKHVYVRKGDRGDILVAKVENGQPIEEKDTVALDAQEARSLGIQLLKLSTDPVKETGMYLNATGIVESVSVFQRLNPDETPSGIASIEINEDEKAEAHRLDNGLNPNFSMEGEELEKLISILAKIV